MGLAKGSETSNRVTTIQQMYRRMIESMEVKGLEIPLTAVKFYKLGEKIPDQVMDNPG